MNRLHFSSFATERDLRQAILEAGRLCYASGLLLSNNGNISARLGELGRQPYTARKFFIQYQDRILFGSDMSPDLDAYRLCYRLLETDDEYFNYNTGEVPGQGRFYAYGLYLPDEVLKKVYRENAMKVLKIK